MPATRFFRSKVLAVGLAAVLGMGLVGITPALADDPTNSQEALTAWDNAQHDAEVAAEQLNGARQAQTDAEAAAAAAATAVEAAKANVATAQAQAKQAADTVASFQEQLDTFTNASFRGAHLGGLTALFTAESASDFLDQATTLNEVANDTAKTLADADAARAAADKAAQGATDAEAAATQSKSDADAAKTAADQAAVEATTKKADLDASVAKYQDLYYKLSDSERAAAAAKAAQEKAESDAAAAAAVARQQLQPAAAAQQAPAADAPAADSASSDSSLAAAAAGSAPQPGAGGDALGQGAAAAAMTKIGGGYCYACDGPDSFDCSGLTTWAWATQGISIPRVSYLQANYPQVALSELEPGDLVTYYSPVSHVAIYVGDGMVVSAANEQLGIRYVPVAKGGPNPTGHRVPR